MTSDRTSVDLEGLRVEVIEGELPEACRGGVALLEDGIVFLLLEPGDCAGADDGIDMDAWLARIGGVLGSGEPATCADMARWQRVDVIVARAVFWSLACESLQRKCQDAY